MENRFQALDQLRRSRRAAHMNLLQAGEVELPRSGAFSSAFAMVGTSDMAVRLLSWIRRKTVVGSKRRTITCFSPIMVEACGRPHPLAWNSGMVCSSTPYRRD